MRKQSLILLVAVTVGAALFVAGASAALADDSAGLAVDVSQAEDGNATVAVTDNGTAVANATVTVETVENASYDGVGEYLTDENGTVGLPAPENETTINVSAVADNETATTQATLTPPEEEDEEEMGSFGQQVSSFISSLQEENSTDRPFGHLVSSFVLDNNPAADKIPDHAGPPENGTGPPEHAGAHDDAENETEDDAPGRMGNDTDDRGPPEHAGPDDDERGPPDHADGDDADDEEMEDEEDEEEAEEDEDDGGEDDEDDEEDGESGPPGHAGPP